MIPIRDDNPTRTTPYVVYTLIALNVLIFLIDRIGATGPVGGLWGFAMIPYEIWTGNNIQIAIGQYIIPPSPEPVYVTIVSSMFLHGGFLHLAGNMLYLWIFGNNIEDVLGHVKFLIFYLIGGIIAALAHIVSNPMSQVPTVGASGAIAAVLGAYMILFPNSKVTTLIFIGIFVTTAAVPAVVVLGLWIFLQFISVALGGGMTPGGGVAYWAHIGGFLAGVIGILLLGGKTLIVRQRRQRDYRRNWYEE